MGSLAIYCTILHGEQQSAEHTQMRRAGNVASVGGSKNALNVLVANPEVQRPLLRPIRKWEDSCGSG